MENDKREIIAKLRVVDNHSTPNLIRSEQVVVKGGPRTYKTASILYFGDKDKRTIKSVKLIVRSYSKHPDGKYDFDNADYTWNCEDKEIRVVQALLNTEFPRTGKFNLISEKSPERGLIEKLEDGSIDSETVNQIISALTVNKETGQMFSSLPAAKVIADLVSIHRQKDALENFKSVVLDPGSSESQIQASLAGQSWIFGGKFVGTVARRALTVLDQLDIPLLRADGSLHIVELKKANIPHIVRLHRNHLIVGNEVHDAVSQGENYLRSLDEQRPVILTELGVDCRRSSVTVIIGHPSFSSGFDEDEISETLRTYNSHLSRVEVITYKELIDGASRLVDLVD